MGSYASEPKIDVCSITTNLLVPTLPNQTIQVPIGNCISFRLPSSIRNFMYNDCLQGDERTGRILTQFKIASGSWSPLYPSNFDCNSSDVTPIINITEETQFRFVILSSSFVSGVYNWVNGEYLGPYIDPGWQFYNIPSITVTPTLIPSNAIRTPGSNQITQECVVPNQDLKIYPPTGYPLVTTQEEITCRKFGGLYPQTHYTNYTLEKSNNASTFQFVDRQSNYGFIPTQNITSDLTSYRYKFSAPTSCIPGADQNGAYYHNYTSGELRLFTSAYTYNQTIGDLFELVGTQRSKTTPTMSGCSTPTKLYVDPPLKYGIANSDLTYKWILPSNWQLHSSNSTNEGKGLNEINVIPINFNLNTSPTSENVTLEISWTSPCGRVDKITRTFTVNYDFNLQKFGSLFSGYNSSDNLNDPYLFYGQSFGASLSTSFISCNANLFIQTPMYYSETELKEGFMNRNYILEDNLGPLVAGSDYLIEPATSMDQVYLSKNNFITPTELRNKKLIVRINLTDFYFNSRNIIQTEIRHKINFTGACQSFTRSNLRILKSYHFKSSATPPAPTINSNIDLCLDNNIVFNIGLLNKPKNTTWKFFNGSTQLVENIDYTIVNISNTNANATIKFNSRIFGTTNPLNAVTLTAQYDANFIGSCGLKTSESLNFIIYNNTLAPIALNPITKQGNCSAGNNLNTNGISDPNIIKFYLPNKDYRSVVWSFKQSVNGTPTNNSFSYSNFKRYFDSVNDRWVCENAFRENTGMNLGDKFDIQVQATVYGFCGTQKIATQIFTNIKNANPTIPNIRIDNTNKLIACTQGDDDQNYKTINFQMPALNVTNFDKIKWSFTNLATNLPYNNFIITDSTIKGSINVMFSNINTDTLRLRASAILTDSCAVYQKDKDFTLFNNQPDVPAMVLQNPKPLFCAFDIASFVATPAPNMKVKDYIWDVKGSNTNPSPTTGTNLLTNTNQISTTNTLNLDLSKIANFRYLAIRVRTRFEGCSGLSGNSSFINIERRTIGTATTGTISYLDPAFTVRTKNEKLCNGNNAYFYTNAPSSNNTWLWKIDNALVATTVEPKLKLPVNFATHDKKIVTLQTIDANGCPTLPISAEAIGMNNEAAPILAYDKTLVNVPVSYTKYDVPGGRNVNGHASVMYVKNTNTAVTGTMDWKWYEQNNFVPNNSALNCYVTNNMNIVEVKVPAAQPGSFSKTTKPDADNTIRQLQFSFWAGGSYIPNLSCKYTVMAKNTYDISLNRFCWSDPYIVMTEGASGTGPLRKEVLDENTKLDTELDLEPTIYPNPTTGIILIKLPTQTGKLNIYNSLGVLMNSYQLNTSESSLDLSAFASGVYTLQIQTEIKTTYTKLIISE